MHGVGCVMHVDTRNCFVSATNMWFIVPLLGLVLQRIVQVANELVDKSKLTMHILISLKKHICLVHIINSSSPFVEMVDLSILAFEVGQ